jgi:hypothetical protein
MRIHIVGAGPTGMSLAWEIKKYTDHDVSVYDRKTSCGGAWWEPDTDVRDIHAHKILFDQAFVNTRSLLTEMGIKWDDMFEKVNILDIFKTTFKNLNLTDYISLASLATRVLSQPNTYKGITLQDAVGSLSENGKKVIQALPYIMDGVGWETMSAYEFIKSFDHVGMSSQYTQRVSGKYMCDKMQVALVEAGVDFEFNKTLTDVQYKKDGYRATFDDDTFIEDGLLVLCVDSGHALNLIKDNWGDEAHKQISSGVYKAINILIDYENPIESKMTDLEIAMNKSPLRLQPVILSNNHTISCVICDIDENVQKYDPEVLKSMVLQQLKLPKPKAVRIGWASVWKGDEWHYKQTSSVMSIHGQIPFFGESPDVAMCGMMSDRSTPYSSIESAIEVSRIFCHEKFDTRRPLRSVVVTNLLLVMLILVIFILRQRL